MNIPAEFVGRVAKTKLSGLITSPKRLTEILKAWPGSEIDVVYEKRQPIIVVVFESSEDCLAFKLKYGDEYV